MSENLRDVMFKWTGNGYPTDTIQYATVSVDSEWNSLDEYDDDDIFYYFSSEEELNEAYSDKWANENDFVLVKGSN